jgi:hypothetical protein
MKKILGNEPRRNKRNSSDFKICDENEAFGVLHKLEQKLENGVFGANDDAGDLQVDVARRSFEGFQFEEERRRAASIYRQIQKENRQFENTVQIRQFRDFDCQKCARNRNFNSKNKITKSAIFSFFYSQIKVVNTKVVKIQNKRTF